MSSNLLMLIEGKGGNIYHSMSALVLAFISDQRAGRFEPEKYFFKKFFLLVLLLVTL